MASFLGPGCYLSHRREADTDTDGGRRDAGARDSGTPDSGRPDAGVRDAGPPREPRWLELSVGEEGPPPRLNHLAVIDSSSDRMIVFGGFDPYGDIGGCCLTPYIYHRDVWTLDLRIDTWAHVAELDRALLSIHPVEVAFDRPRNRLVFVAQTDFDSGWTETFALDLSSWALSSLPSGPWPAGAGPLRAAHDQATGELVVHDALREDTVRGAWAFDLASDRWSGIEMVEPPEVRFHTPLTSAGSGTFFMYGGYAHAGEAIGELWRFDRAGGRWSPVGLDEEQGGRWSHRAVWEPTRRTLVIFAGNRHTVERGTLIIEPERGTARELELDPAPGPRRDFTMVLDGRRRRAIVFGGALQSTRAYRDAWALELP